MKLFLITVLAVATLTSGAAAEPSATLVVTPDYNITVAGDEYHVSCEIEGSTHGEDLLKIQSNKENSLNIKNTWTSLQATPVGFNASNYKLNMAASGDSSKVSVSLVIVPDRVGSLSISCLTKTRTFHVIKVTRTATKDVLSAEFVIPRSYLTDVPEAANKDKTKIVIVAPAAKGQDLTQDLNTNCTTDADTDSYKYCYTVKPKANLAAGRYRFELKSGDKTLAVASENVEGPITIKECSGHGSNCIADSEYCYFKCVVDGWPYESCSVSGKGELPPTNSRMQVECLPNEHMIKIRLDKPTQDDSGFYNVTAVGGPEKKAVEGQLQIRVKDKLAPLWPFLGICAEVVILCGIILFFEKRHQKKLQQQEQEEASEPLNKNSGKGGNDVRQRAVKA